jgi:hypothetical protein
MSEQLLTLKEFCALFKRNYRATQAAAKAGRLKDTQRIGGRWYVLVPKRAVDAARSAAA